MLISGIYLLLAESNWIVITYTAKGFIEGTKGSCFVLYEEEQFLRKGLDLSY